MKLRGPASSLNPSREAARATARMVSRVARVRGSGSGGAVHATGLLGGDLGGGWRFEVDDQQRVCLVHGPTQTRVVLAEPITTTEGTDR